MSNKLKKKKNKSQFGWLNKEVKQLQKVQDDRDRRAMMLTESFHRMQEVGAYILHEDFGYSVKALRKIDGRMNAYLCAYEEGTISPDTLNAFIGETMKIDTRELVKKIPIQYKMRTINELLPKKHRGNAISNMSMMDMGIQMFFIYYIVAIRHARRDTKSNRYRYDLSIANLKKFLDKFQEYIEILCYQSKYQLIHQDLVDALSEVGYTVERHDLWKDDYLERVI